MYSSSVWYCLECFATHSWNKDVRSSVSSIIGVVVKVVDVDASFAFTKRLSSLTRSVARKMVKYLNIILILGFLGVIHNLYNL